MDPERSAGSDLVSAKLITIGRRGCCDSPGAGNSERIRQGVSVMPEATRTQSRARVTLNSDGQRHPMENGLTAFTFVVGMLAFAISFIVRAHLAGSVLGLVAFVVGLYAQMVSNTREQRVLIMAGIIAAFVGLGLSVAHGGFG
jgi:membrane-bound ClpP family serine protease